MKSIIRNKIKSVAITSALILMPICTMAAEPNNIAFTKQHIINYYNSGEYNNDIRNVSNKAISYLTHRVSQNKLLTHPKKLAIVFDIDETSLSNYPDILKMDFGGMPKTVDLLENQARDPAIKPILKLYNEAVKNGVTVFFITGRKDFQRKATIQNLKSAGYTSWETLYTKPNTYSLSSVVPYKSSKRNEIIKQGYDIIINIGDQWSDLNGGGADKIYKVPDPFYFIK